MVTQVVAVVVKQVEAAEAELMARPQLPEPLVPMVVVEPDPTELVGRPRVRPDQPTLPEATTLFRLSSWVEEEEAVVVEAVVVKVPAPQSVLALTPLLVVPDLMEETAVLAAAL